MDDVFKVALPAAIALVGTVAGLVLTYRQAKRRPQAEAAAAYASDRRAAFKSLWEQLEDVHAYARSLEVDPALFYAHMQAVSV